MENNELLKKINELITKSKGNPILLDKIFYSFNRLKKYSVNEIKQWEKENNIQFPQEYKSFLIHVGACQLYFDKYQSGIEFLLLENIKKMTADIFMGLQNPFPKLIFIGSNLNNGDMIGYNLNTKNRNNLSIYSIEEQYPENWININEFISLEIFLKKLIQSNGEDYYL